MQRAKLGGSVYDVSIKRLISLFGHEHSRVVTKISGGKDATLLMELSIEAARSVGRLPIDVVYHDEELCIPGTNEYMEKVGNRTKEVNLHWLYGYFPIENVFDRECPFWWTFDPLYSKPSYITSPPKNALYKPGVHVIDYISPEQFPAKRYPNLSIGCSHCSQVSTIARKESLKKCPFCKKFFEPKWDHLPDDPFIGQTFISSGHRASESPNRRMVTASRGGFVAKTFNHNWTADTWPIYDWTTGDVWKAIGEKNWDYNKGYDGLLKGGVKKRDLRIVALTIANTSLRLLKIANKVWPNWGEKACNRIHGVRQALKQTNVHPAPRKGETWKHLHNRVCLNNAPEWIKNFHRYVVEHYKRQHEAHGGRWENFPDGEKPCTRCKPNDSGSWKSFIVRGYSGFPLIYSFPKYEPPDHEKFRPIIEARLHKERGKV